MLRGRELVGRGSTPEDAFEPGIARCKAAIPLAPDIAVLFTQAELEVEYSRALIEKGRDAGTALTDADRALDEALRIDARNVEPLRIRADGALVRARWAMQKGRDPVAFLAAAERDARLAVAVNPLWDYAHRSLVRLDAARLEWRRRAPAAASAEARRGLRDVRRALEVHPGWPELLALEAQFKRVH
jgi:hypothetical protein